MTKKFGDFTAVDAVTLSVDEGEIFGLLGPNGAGKTTLISMLVTLKHPTAGGASVNGFDIARDPDSVRRSIGIVFQDPSLDEELTAYENLELHAVMYGMPKAERDAKIKEVVALVELSDRLNDLVKTFSGGMRRRLEISRSLLHNPKILFLDEPTIGLDPQTRRHVWDYVKRLRNEKGVTLVLTTHYLEEADALCDRIAIIDAGKNVALDTPKRLKDSLGGDVIEAECDNPKKLAAALKGKAWAKDVKATEGKITFKVEAGEKRVPEVIAAANAKGITVDSIALRKPALDDVFLHYTGRGIREEKSSATDAMRMRRRAWHK